MMLPWVIWKSPNLGPDLRGPRRYCCPVAVGKPVGDPVGCCRGRWDSLTGFIAMSGQPQGEWGVSHTANPSYGHATSGRNHALR